MFRVTSYPKDELERMICTSIIKGTKTIGIDMSHTHTTLNEWGGEVRQGPTICQVEERDAAQELAATLRNKVGVQATCEKFL